jgi:hypothetical protein
VVIVTQLTSGVQESGRAAASNDSHAAAHCIASCHRSCADRFTPSSSSGYHAVGHAGLGLGVRREQVPFRMEVFGVAAGLAAGPGSLGARKNGADRTRGW